MHHGVFGVMLSVTGYRITRSSMFCFLIQLPLAADFLFLAHVPKTDSVHTGYIT